MRDLIDHFASFVDADQPVNEQTREQKPRSKALERSSFVRRLSKNTLLTDKLKSIKSLDSENLTLRLSHLYPNSNRAKKQAQVKLKRENSFRIGRTNQTFRQSTDKKLKKSKTTNFLNQAGKPQSQRKSLTTTRFTKPIRLSLKEVLEEHEGSPVRVNSSTRKNSQSSLHFNRQQTLSNKEDSLNDTSNGNTHQDKKPLDVKLTKLKYKPNVILDQGYLQREEIENLKQIKENRYSYMVELLRFRKLLDRSRTCRLMLPFVDFSEEEKILESHPRELLDSYGFRKTEQQEKAKSLIRKALLKADKLQETRKFVI